MSLLSFGKIIASLIRVLSGAHPETLSGASFYKY